MNYVTDKDLKKLGPAESAALRNWITRFRESYPARGERSRRPRVESVRKEIGEYGECLHAARVYARIFRERDFFAQRYRCLHCGEVGKELASISLS